MINLLKDSIDYANYEVKSLVFIFRIGSCSLWIYRFLLLLQGLISIFSFSYERSWSFQSFPMIILQLFYKFIQVNCTQPLFFDTPFSFFTHLIASILRTSLYFPSLFDTIQVVSIIYCFLFFADPSNNLVFPLPFHYLLSFLLILQLSFTNLVSPLWVCWLLLHRVSL